MRLFYCLLISIIAPTFIITAQGYTVSGSVKDRNNVGVAYANVLLLKPSDSTFVTGASTDDKGFFVMYDVPSDIYYVTASYVGNTSRLIPVDIYQTTEIGSVIIDNDAQLLDEVVVYSKLPVVNRKIDRLVFNVENTVVSQGSSWDILKQTPGVILNRNELKIRNQSATVYINDRKVQLSADEVKDLLENYSGENITTVEVITSPPSKYDAEGGPILNIITNKNISLGYKGNFNGTYTQGVFSKYSLGTSHFYKTKNLNIYANYTFNPKKEYKKDDSHIDFINNSAIFSRWETDFNRTTRSRSHNANLNLDYDFDDRNELNISASGLFSPDKTYENDQFTEIRNTVNVLDSTFTTISSLGEDKNNLSADISYKHSFKGKGAIKLNGHYTKFNLDRTQNASSDYFDPQGAFMRNYSFFTVADQNIDIYTTQLDIESVIGSINIETGLKAAFINSESGLDYYNVANGSQTFNINLSDNFLYDEKVYAGYFSLTKDWENWSLKTGLRAEQTKSSGNSVALSTINDLEYFELFPTFYLLYSTNEDHSFSFDYSRKLKRPRYQDLNPFRYFLNENDFTIGNPDLRPNFSNNFNFNYTFKGEYFFDLYYRDNGNYMSTLSFQDNQNLTLRQVKQNVLESVSYGLDFTYGKSVCKNWFLYSYMSLFSEEETFLALESGNQAVTNSLDGFYGYLGNYLSLSQDGTFTGELSLGYLTGNLYGSYIQDPTTTMTIGLRKSLWKNRAVVSVAVEDVLGKANGNLVSRYLNQDNAYFAKPETQFVRFGFTYNFGNFRLQDNERDIDKIERDRLGAQ